MKREIKFRAWYEGKMYEVYELNISGDTVAINLPRFPFIQDVVPDAIMQYTGLKDKNGKEIYEGDILKSEFGHIGIVKFGKCCYSIEGFFINWNDGDITGFDDSAHLDIEIIGNIYENPELL